MMELIVVIAILSAMTALVLPSIKFPNRHGERTLLQIQKPIEAWRIYALKNSEPMVLKLDGVRGEISAVKADEQEILELSPSESKLEIHRVDSSFYIHTQQKEKATEAQINVDADGSTKPFEIYITDEGKRLTFNGLATPARFKNAPEE